MELTERVAVPIGSCTVTSFPVLHPSGAPSYAFRVELADKIFAYSGDTEWTDVLAEVAAGADLFICEAYFYETKVRYHLNYKDLLARREQLGCRRLIMTHMNQDLLSRLTEVKVEYATDGLTIVL
jgi:ribonuclease BN (tRNA processing enzyme)